MDISGLLEDTHVLRNVPNVVIGYDVDLVSGKCREVYEGHGKGLIASTW